MTDDENRRRAAELTELISEAVTGAEPVDWKKVARWASEVTALARGIDYIPAP